MMAQVTDEFHFPYSLNEWASGRYRAESRSRPLPVPKDAISSVDVLSSLGQFVDSAIDPVLISPLVLKVADVKSCVCERTRPICLCRIRDHMRRTV